MTARIGRASDAISEEPLINAVHRKVVELSFAIYTSLLVYLSFVPFDFGVCSAPASGSVRIWGMALAPFSMPDILANIALYTPLGALGFAVWRRRKLGRITSVVLALLTAALLSFFVEQGQYWVRSRVSTWVDVTANVLGGLCGVTLVLVWEGQIRRILMRARRSAKRNWSLTLAKGAACLVLCISLRPYDVVVDVRHAAVGVRHADMSPLAAWKDLQRSVVQEVKAGRRHGTHELPRVQWEYALDRGTDVLMYAALAALVAIGLASHFAGPVRLYLWAGFVSISLAGIVTVMRIFLISRGLDTSHFFCGVLGWPLGCAVARAVLGNRAKLEPGAGLPRVPTAWARLALVVALLTVVVYELVPFDLGTGGGITSPTAADRVCILPFEAHFNSRPNDAFYDISGELLRYGLFGACMAVLLRRRHKWSWRRQLWAVVALVGIVSTVLECLHLFMATRQTDVTTVLLAMIGSFAGVVSVRWAFDYRASLSVAFADDLLTGQLIEGETYRGLPDVGRERSSEQQSADGRSRTRA